MKSHYFKNIKFVLILGILGHLIIGSAMAQSADSQPGKPPIVPKVSDETAEQEEILSKYFGAGIMANIDLGGPSNLRVKNARLVAGKVRIDEESKAQVGFFLEAHKFTKGSPDGLSKTVNGPFVGLVMGGDAGIDTAILGWMWGFRQPKTTQTLNLGLGLAISPHAQTLGDGLAANSPLPVGETEIRYKKTTKYGLAFSVSFGF
ncbi:hypothetical protein [Undibacterium flavidum]|uniref:Outer membrane protein with beta-barrel domain n=1 Tax=Undibacterium flavidum TaxID=2762297 RepID=A0ABR6YEY9_9BURK|nr:hypothetical protein [Undibacterium flavidum]MBC3875129.1 hypothetical protein [Undibacterium flavidum]